MTISNMLVIIITQTMWFCCLNRTNHITMLKPRCIVRFKWLIWTIWRQLGFFGGGFRNVQFQPMFLSGYWVFSPWEYLSAAAAHHITFTCHLADVFYSKRPKISEFSSRIKNQEKVTFLQESPKLQRIPWGNEADVNPLTFEWSPSLQCALRLYTRYLWAANGLHRRYEVTAMFQVLGWK